MPITGEKTTYAVFSPESMLACSLALARHTCSALHVCLEANWAAKPLMISASLGLTRRRSRMSHQTPTVNI